MGSDPMVDPDTMPADIALDLDTPVEQPEPTPEPSRLVTAFDAVNDLVASWDDAREAPTSTGLRLFDDALHGGVRRGDVVMTGGAAGSGKSIVSSQVAYDAAADGAVVVYASVEMPPRELAARWVAMRCFRERMGDLSFDANPVTFGALLAAQHDRARDDVVNAAAQRLREETGGRLYVHKVAPGTTTNELRALVSEARKAHPAVERCLLVVDPLQRLFVAADGHINARVAERLNQSETERITHVASQVKNLADTEGLALWCNCDTTKGSADKGAGGSQGLRGSYQLNHNATVVLWLSSAKSDDAEVLKDALKTSDADADVNTSDATDLLKRLPREATRFITRKGPLPLGVAHGARFAVMENSKARNSGQRAVVGLLLRAVNVFLEEKART